LNMTNLLDVRDGELRPTSATRALLARIGGVDRLTDMTFLFYQKMFADTHLRQFLGALHTPLEEHARRLAMYIAETMGADGSPWSADIQQRPKPRVSVANGRTVVVDSRASAHAAAWHSVARQPSHVGRRFKLEDCRIWMRLMFLSCREAQLGDEDDDAFFAFFQQWVGHFIPIYERTAKHFVAVEAQWSRNRANVQQYFDDGCTMTDVVGVPPEVALAAVRRSL
jgi:truncated hemoglobin YjbI